jgi:hypothetical protein
VTQAVSLFQFGADEVKLNMTQKDNYQESDPVPLETLDGHVLLESDAGRTIATFSQGGGPGTGTVHEPPPPPPDGTSVPITAGSSDGAVLLFFGEKPPDDGTDYQRVKVVTTALHGAPGGPELPGIQRSQVFCVAASHRLPLGLKPTLVIVYEPLEDLNERKREVLTICRLDPSDLSSGWKPLPTYVPSDVATVVPLAYDADGPLVREADDDHRVEFFVICSGV